ncbi:hypothetical protein JCM10207_002649 [Rhodosporidiobolus poonsookiae]
MLPSVACRALDLAVAQHVFSQIEGALSFLNSLTSHPSCRPTASSPLLSLPEDILHLVRGQLLADAVDGANASFTCERLVCAQCIAVRPWIEHNEGERFKSWEKQVEWLKTGHCGHCYSTHLHQFLRFFALELLPPVPSLSPVRQLDDPSTALKRIAYASLSTPLFPSCAACEAASLYSPNPVLTASSLTLNLAATEDGALDRFFRLFSISLSANKTGCFSRCQVKRSGQ